MKVELFIVVLSMVLVFGIAYGIFITQENSFRITGLVVEDSTGDIPENNGVEEVEIIVEMSEQDALNAISESEKTISEMEKEGFSVSRLEDILLEARRTYEQMKNAEILRDEASPYRKKRDAQKSLALVDWKKLTYGDVLTHTDEIKKLREEAYLLLDSIGSKEILLSPSDGEVEDEDILRLQNEIDKAFQDERYEDTKVLLEELDRLAELKESEKTFIKTVQRNTGSFVQRNWFYILVILIFISVGGYIVYKKEEKRRLRNKIRKMKIESNVLMGLMKKAQTERFKDNKISALVYNTKIKKYKNRLQEIKEQLPVLNARLKKVKKKRQKPVSNARLNKVKKKKRKSKK